MQQQQVLNPMPREVINHLPELWHAQSGEDDGLGREESSEQTLQTIVAALKLSREEF